MTSGVANAILPLVLSAEAVERHLPYDACIPLMRDTMAALSRGATRQVPRQILHLDQGNMLGVMPGALRSDSVVGVKVVSVYPRNIDRSLPSHQGAVLLFEPDGGALVAVVDAHAITRIRTASASAAATDALARRDAATLAVLGYGEQARAHIEAISRVRTLDRVTIWGRDAARCAKFVIDMIARGYPCEAAADAASAAAGSAILCTTTSAAEPILFGRDVAAGTHVNVVGSSFAGPAEIDVDLVSASRYFADSRENVLAQGEELLRARAAGRVGDDHVVAEIGEVFAGAIPGRMRRDDITIYKSLGHVAQDLASSWHVFAAATKAKNAAGLT